MTAHVHGEFSSCTHRNILAGRLKDCTYIYIVIFIYLLDTDFAVCARVHFKPLAANLKSLL